jgi:hypothetical protein
LPIAICVENDEEAVGVGERGVAAALGADDELGRAVVVDHADVERVFGVEHAHLGVLRGRLPLIGRRLPESADDLRSGPGLVVEDVAIDDWRYLSRRCLGGH